MWHRADVCLAEEALTLQLPQNTDAGTAAGFWEQPGGQQVSSCPLGNVALEFLPRLRLIPCTPSVILVPQRWFCRLLPLFFPLEWRCCVSLGGVCTLPFFFLRIGRIKKSPYRRGYLHFHYHISPCTWLCNTSL